MGTRIETPPNNSGAADTRRIAALADNIDALADQTVVAAQRTTGGGTGGLEPLATLLGAVDRIIAAAITLLQRVDRSDVIIGHGITIDAWLRAIARRTGADTGMLLAAADRLADMPAVSAWFTDGTLSWGTVRGIVAATRNLTADQRAWLDATLADQRHRITVLDGDQIAAAVERLADDARPDLHRDRADRAFTNRYLAIQPALDGTARIHGTLDTETAAAALTAFDTTPHLRHHDDDREATAVRRQSNVDRFKALCEQRVTRTGHNRTSQSHTSDRDGDDGRTAATSDDTDGDRHTGETGGVCDACGAAPSTARPSMLIVADITALTGTTNPDAIASATAQLLWRTNNSPVELTADAAQRLACDATLRVVLADGTVPLGAGAAHPKISTSLRAALAVRDGGCRFAACHHPADRCDAHHLRPIADGGDTKLHNLALLCRAHHRAVHEGGWTATLHTDATITFTRRGTTLTSQPRATQRIRPTTPPPTGRPHRPQRRRQPDANSHGTDQQPAAPGNSERRTPTSNPSAAELPF